MVNISYTIPQQSDKFTSIKHQNLSKGFCFYSTTKNFEFRVYNTYDYIDKHRHDLYNIRRTFKKDIATYNDKSKYTQT